MLEIDIKCFCIFFILFIFVNVSYFRGGIISWKFIGNGNEVYFVYDRFV